MPDWLAGQTAQLGAVVAKAALMYLVALFGLRLAHRRALSQWTTIDMAAAVAVGALVGRTAVASGQSFLVGAVALLTLLLAHTVMTYARFDPRLARALDHRVRVLVEHGRLRRGEMRRCGLTESDLLAHLREQGVDELSDVRWVLYETKCELTVVREPGAEVPDRELVRRGLEDAAGWRSR